MKHVLWVSNDKVNFTTQYSYIAVKCVWNAIYRRSWFLKHPSNGLWDATETASRYKEPLKNFSCSNDRSRLGLALKSAWRARWWFFVISLRLFPEKFRSFGWNSHKLSEVLNTSNFHIWAWRIYVVKIVQWYLDWLLRTCVPIRKSDLEEEGWNK